MLSNTKVAPSGGSTITYKQFENRLLQMFKSGDSFDSISNWISANMRDRLKDKEFARSLATAIFEDSIRNNVYYPDVLKTHFQLFFKFIDGNPLLELQCIYALQALVNKLEHPKGK